MMTSMTALTPRPAHATLDELLNELVDRADPADRPADGVPGWRLEPMDKHHDSLSGAPFEYAFVNGERLVVKHIGRDLDWIMRVLGDGADGTRPWALTLWQEGLLDAMPADIDTAVVGMAYDPATGRLHQVMRDIGATLIPDGSVPFEQHRRLIDHMAALHARFWGFADTYGLITAAGRYGFAHPDRTAEEAAAGHADAIPQMFPGGWAAARALEPEAADLALAIAAEPDRLGDAMAAGPRTLVHGDWKFGNLGSHPDGRTVLLDWAWPGEASPLVDLAWYLAVNCDRLPESKEDTIAAYRASLAGRGISTDAWWDRQLDLALLGAFVQLGWSKAGNPDELRWWTDRVVPTARALLTSDD